MLRLSKVVEAGEDIAETLEVIAAGGRSVRPCARSFRAGSARG